MKLASWISQFILIFMVAIFYGNLSLADARVLLQTGYGQSDTNVEGKSGIESPGLISFAAEYVTNERSTVGVEHFRTYEYVTNKFSTAVSFSGIFYRWYFLTPISQNLGSATDYKGNYLTQINFSPYILGSFGVAQSSLRDKTGGALTKGSVGAYSSVRVGVDYPFFSQVGIVSDVLYGQTLVGTGSISVYGFGLGIYFNF